MERETEREPNTWDRLSAQFNDADVSSVRSCGRNYRYISAPVCRRRLNQVVGPAGWQNRTTYSDGAAVCTLSIDIAGEPVTRAALGYDEPDRPADDVAFSHACELFGIGSYLAIDDSRYARPALSASAPAAAAPPPRDERPPARDERDEYRDDPAPRRDDRPARQDYRERGGGYPRERGNHGPRGPREGGGWGSGPRPGKSAFRWVMEQEEKHPNGVGLRKHLERWMKDNRIRGMIADLGEHDLHAMIDEANAYLAQEVGAGR